MFKVKLFLALVLMCMFGGLKAAHAREFWAEKSKGF